MNEFLAMSGYGKYLWPAFGLGFGVVVLIYVSAKLRDEDPFPRLEEELAQEGERLSPAPVRTLDPRPRS